MAAERNRRQVSPPAGAQGEHVADLVDRHLAAQRFRRALEPGAHLGVLYGQRLAVDAALGRAADGGRLHQGRPQALRIDAQVARHSAVPRVGERRNLTRAGGSGPRVLASRAAGPCWKHVSDMTPATPLGGDLPDPPPFEDKKEGVRGLVMSETCLRHDTGAGGSPLAQRACGVLMFTPMSITPNAERKTLILTGASRGIGHATVKRFASAGWRVITCSRHGFPENCPWEMGPEDHIQVDLADPEDTLPCHRRDARSASRPRTAASTRWSATPPSRPRARAARRLGAIETPLEDWQHVFQVNFFAPIMLARGLIAELERAQGRRGQRHLHRRRPRAPLRGRRLRHLQGGARRPDARDGGRLRPARHPRQRHLAGRDRHRDPLARHRQDRAGADPAAAGWASPRRWPRPSISCAPTSRAT